MVLVIGRHEVLFGHSRCVRVAKPCRSVGIGGARLRVSLLAPDSRLIPLAVESCRVQV